MPAKKGSRTWFPRIDGGVHLRIWFAKARKGTEADAGMVLPAEQQIENGTYSMNMSIFDPVGISKEEAVELGKEGSVYRNYGSQFGAQIWRMANEAQIGDYIFLESENHHLHAVGIISGEYIPFESRDYTMEDFKNQGVHSIPVKWIPITDGKDYIQLGRLDNAVFRDVAEKPDLAALLIFGTQKIVAEALKINYQEFENRMDEIGGKEDPNPPAVRFLTAGKLPADFHSGLPELLEYIHSEETNDEEVEEEVEQEEAEDDIVVTIEEPAKPVAPVVEAPKPVIAYVARNGTYIHQRITEEFLHQLIQSEQVLTTDHVYHPISTNWITVVEYLKLRCRI